MKSKATLLLWIDQGEVGMWVFLSQDSARKSFKKILIQSILFMFIIDQFTKIILYLIDNNERYSEKIPYILI